MKNNNATPHSCAKALLLCVLGMAPLVAGAATREARIDAAFADMDNIHSPGAMVEVIQDGKVAFARGYGMADIEQGSPIRPETVFQMASMSKQFTAMCIALLAEQGKLRLDQDVRSIVPELPRYGRTITIEQLIHHTSGLRDYLGLWSLSGRAGTDSMPEEEALDLVSRQKATNFEPGSEYLYSNTGYMLLALIVHRVSGEPLSVFAEKNIFAPLGMAHTHFHDDVTRIVPFIAAPYAHREDGSLALVRSQNALVGAGKLNTTVGDLLLWDQNFYHNRLGKGTPALIQQVLTQGILNDGKRIDYAFALNVKKYRGLDVVSHSGGSYGISTDMERFPNQHVSVIVLSNNDEGHAVHRALQVADIWLEGTFPEPPPVHSANHDDGPQAPAPIQLNSAQLAQVVGDYYSDELDTHYVITNGDGKLQVKARSHLSTTLVPLADGHFRFEGDEGGVTGDFIRNTDGNITGFTLDAGRVKGIGFTGTGR